ncbi:LANO_0D07800g1_1 [Lachancea nothofagi CBS 11611]|uniref:LANO_0D07800g1_1 n=1 Tax=Lachancea nothofagi CBS 11611 TaxID=1266666 RepID=A0A1G4JJ34_9SACH|nr:LANO_0D07800g1_1 [Lachancea nothofagi CBS 11611]
MNRQAHNNPPARVVYLGSIPYDQTEEQILDLCSNVGPVVNLKMMFDPQTGRSKGYAFVEYRDLEASASAVRNLNGYQLGNRHLKCGYYGGGDMVLGGAGNGSTLQNEEEKNPLFMGLPPGIDVNINMTTPAMMISSVLAKGSKEEQIDLLRALQSMAQNNAEQFTNLLEQCPQLSFVVAELLLTTGLSTVDDLTQLAVQNNSTKSTPEAVQDPKIQEQQRELLRQVLQLTDSEIAVLPEDEKMSLWDLKQKAMRGEFGMI